MPHTTPSDKPFQEVLMNFSHVPTLVATYGPDVVYIGRAGRGHSGLFGNPVRFNRPCPVCGARHKGPGSTLRCYRIYFRRRLATDPAFHRAVLTLAGKRLWCPGCRGHHLCHGQVIRTWFASGCPTDWPETQATPTLKADARE